MAELWELLEVADRHVFTDLQLGLEHLLAYHILTILIVFSNRPTCVHRI